MKKQVVIGLSGGVDSSVAAWILKESGYKVTGLFMRNWNETTGLLQSDCHWEDDLMFAEMVAKKLDIPFNFIDLSKPYREKVVDYMFSEYEKGRTPNPDILCNREIKFDSFADEAKKLGCDYIATGHYCRKETINADLHPVHRLLSGIDRNKDQSYFLCQLTQEQLGFSLFPLGEITKPEVRKIAKDLGLPTAHRKDSQGICFVGKVHLPTFLQQKLATKPGDTVVIGKDAEFPVWSPEYPVDGISEKELERICKPYTYKVESGNLIGHHEGAHFFTIGQRKGINIGGFKEPLYVIGTDTAQNLLFVGEGDSHPGLFRKGLFISKDEVHWIRKDLEMQENKSRDLLVRIRYRQPLQNARLYTRNKGIYIVFARSQRGITPGQFAAWYNGEELLGSGVINN